MHTVLYWDSVRDEQARKAWPLTPTIPAPTWEFIVIKLYSSTVIYYLMICGLDIPLFMLLLNYRVNLSI